MAFTPQIGPKSREICFEMAADTVARSLKDRSLALISETRPTCMGSCGVIAVLLR